MNQIMATIENLDIDRFIENTDISDIDNVEIIDRKVIPFSQIMRDITTNDARATGTHNEQIHKLINSFSMGINPNNYLPIVSKLNKPIVDNLGNVFYYALEEGFHRTCSLEILGANKYVFDVVKFTGSKKQKMLAKKSLQLRANNPAPQLPSTNLDIINTVSNLVINKCIDNNTKDIKAYINKTVGRSMGTTRIAQIVDAITERTSVQDNFITWSVAKLKYDVPKLFAVSTYGKYDNQNDQHGFSVLKNYEKDFVYNAIMKFGDTEKEIYGIAHVNNPDSEKDLFDGREKLIQKMTEIESNLKKVFDFYQKNGRFPWHVAAFLPQTLDEYECGELVKSNIKPKTKTQNSLDKLLEIS